MPDIVVPISALARGDRIVIEGDIDPIQFLSSLKIIKRGAATPPDALFRVECLAPRDFQWFAPDGTPLTRAGLLRKFTQGVGFQWDVFGQWGTDSRYFVAFISPGAVLATAGAYLVDWPKDARLP